MISFSLGLGNGHQGDLTPVPPVELRALFGSLTKPGAGGMPVMWSPTCTMVKPAPQTMVQPKTASLMASSMKPLQTIN